VTVFRPATLGIAVLVAVGYTGLRQVGTAGNTVPSSRAGVETLLVSPDELMPEQCRGSRLALVVRGAGLVGGTKGNDLILGGPGPDDLQGRSGDDCIIGGDGDDHIDGGGGRDVCIGGPGEDVFHNCATWEQ
jgi:Ca2+-binding RTX toxin-like protein